MYNFKIQPKDFSSYLFHASSLGKIVGTYIAEKTKPALTDKQQEEFEKLIANKERSPRQEGILSKLRAKIERHSSSNIEISSTVQGYLIEIFEEECLGFTRFTGSEATERGIKYEQDSINLLNEVYKTDYTKNERKFCNQYLVGTPDIISATIGDIKTAQNYTTYRKYEQKEADSHSWQLWAYSQLVGKEANTIIRTLPSYPEDDIYLETEKKLKYLKNPTREEIEAKRRETYLNMNYERIPAQKRVKIFKVETYQGDPLLVYNYLDQCRLYLNGIVKGYFEDLNINL